MSKKEKTKKTPKPAEKEKVTPEKKVEAETEVIEKPTSPERKTWLAAIFGLLCKKGTWFFIIFFLVYGYGSKAYYTRPFVDTSNMVDKGELVSAQAALVKTQETSVSQAEYQKLAQENLQLKQNQTQAVVTAKDRLHTSYKTLLEQNKTELERLQAELRESKDRNLGLEAKVASLLEHIKRQQAVIQQLQNR